MCSPITVNDPPELPPKHEYHVTPELTGPSVESVVALCSGGRAVTRSVRRNCGEEPG
jgi:hypothetical protein